MIAASLRTQRLGTEPRRTMTDAAGSVKRGITASRNLRFQHGAIGIRNVPQRVLTILSAPERKAIDRTRKRSIPPISVRKLIFTVCGSPGLSS